MSQDDARVVACVQHGNSWLSANTGHKRVVATVPVEIASGVCKLLSLLAEAEREIARTKVDAKLGREVDGWVCMNTPFTGEPPYVGNAGIMLALRELKAERDALQSRLDAVAGLADRWVNDPKYSLDQCANDLLAALGGESRGNDEVG